MTTLPSQIELAALLADQVERSSASSARYRLLKATHEAQAVCLERERERTTALSACLDDAAARFDALYDAWKHGGNNEAVAERCRTILHDWPAWKQAHDIRQACGLCSIAAGALGVAHANT